MKNQNDENFAVAVIFVLILIAVLAVIGVNFYNTRDIYSSDGYYVKIHLKNVGGGCVIVKTKYRDRLGLAPLILDDGCVRDIRNLHQGDLPSLD